MSTVRFSYTVLNPYENMVQGLLLSHFVPCYQTLTWALRGVTLPLFPFQTPELAFFISWHVWMCAIKVRNGCHICMQVIHCTESLEREP